MGEIIYPGVLINRADPKISEDDVKEYFLNQLYLDNVRFGGLRVHIFGRNGGTTRVVVTGINMSFDDLRVACKRKLKMKDRIVQITNVDFGVERISNGDMQFHLLCLHNHLKEGQGMRESINLLTNQFSSAYGKFSHLEATIYFDDVKENVDTNMLKGLGTSFYTGNIVAHGTLEKNYMKDKLAYSNMEVVMKYRMEAFQAICVLNGKQKFSGLNRCFITSNDDAFKCSLDMQCGLGRKGEILNIEGLVSINRFVPLRLISERIISREKIAQLTTYCFRCSKMYKIVGIGPDFSWLAGKCGCEQQSLLFLWPNEEFTRLILPPTKKTIFGNDHSLCVRPPDKLLVFARGLLPLYDTPLQFRQIAFAAFCLEFWFSKRQLHEKQTIGVLIKRYFVEVCEKNQDSKEWIYALRIKVPKTKLWCEDGLKHMSKATLVPLTEHDSNSGYVSYTEAKNHKWLKGSIREIVPSLVDPDFSIVTLRVIFHSSPTFKTDQRYKIIPKPNTSQRDAIQSVVTKWQKSFTKDAPPAKHFHNLRVHQAFMWNSDTEAIVAWRVRIKICHNELFSIIDSLLTTCYIGVDLGLYVQEKNAIGWKSTTGRVVDVRSDNKSNGWIVDAVLFFPTSMTILKSVSCSASFWVIARRVFDVNKALKEDLSSKIDDFKNMEKGLKNQYVSIHSKVLESVFDVKLDPTVGLGNTCCVKSIWKFWKQRPKRDISQSDFLLHPSDIVDHKINIEYMDDNQKIYDKASVASLRKDLNPSQVTGIDNMLLYRLAMLQGPPGTGKTATVACGICNCKKVDDGKVLGCCPSNFACDVLYDKLKVVNEKHQVGLKVVRMQSTTRQRKMLKEIPLDEADQTQLHVMVRRHPLWNMFPEINAIIQKSMRFSGALLTKDEINALDSHTSRITNRILKQTDVIICTVGCATDGRLKSLLQDGKSSQQLAALVIDEASLLTVPTCLPILEFNPTRVWLVGDHCQLRPSVLNDAAIVSCLDVSWMEFLTLSPFIKKGVNFNMLNVQYRMAAGIASVVSKFMYNDEVKSSEQVKERNYENHPILNEFPELKACNIGCYTYDGPQEQKAYPSYYNVKEVAISKDILVKLKLCGIPMSKVTIITMYACQSTYLTDMVSELGAGFEEVKVSTVDSSQGTESPIIILNMVRSNRKQDNNANVGFLRDQNRINVAMSRSIDFLLIICDVETMKLSNLPDILKLFNLLEEQHVDLSMKK